VISLLVQHLPPRAAADFGVVVGPALRCDPVTGPARCLSLMTHGRLLAASCLIWHRASALRERAEGCSCHAMARTVFLSAKAQLDVNVDVGCSVVRMYIPADQLRWTR
jgi:hypothetical protein